MILKNFLLDDEDYIITRYKNLLKKQGINTVYDLLMEFPSKYEDYTLSDIDNAELDVNMVLEGTIVSKITVNYLKTKLTTVTFQLDVEGKKIRCTIFNRVFLKGKINYGSVIRVQGRFYQNLNNFTVNNLIICDEIDRDIVPVYRVKDISESKYLEIIEKTFRKYRNKIEETLPQEFLDKHNLMSLKDTIYTLHFAGNLEEIDKALYRIKYEELLGYQLSMKYLNYMREKNSICPVINYKQEIIDELINSLSYQLTTDQLSAVEDILKDLKSPYAMNRLLQGEVGSGKTIVAMIAMLAVTSDNFQAALMCPTEILSKQHYETVIETLGKFPHIKVGMLTGSTNVKQRKELLEQIKSGEINIIIGTHALFQKDVEYKDLGIVIADEEHRFGVKQRVLIKNKGLDVNYLKMSATPIPRTLAISVYGDTNISVIKTMPANRKQVITKYISEGEKKLVVEHMKKEIKEGHQIYVVTPLIDESDALATANANEIYTKMTEYFSSIAKVGLIHGKLKAQAKEDIMNSFLNKEIDILVATSIIEVGVNVVNATTIIVLGAERFGVATLHQLRGRVMRSDAVPYCFLIPEKTTELSDERLKMVENNTDGFALAEYDLLNRGPGEFFGSKQSGSMNFKYSDLLKDNDILEIANSDSEIIMKSNDLFNSSEYKYLYNHVHQNYLMKITELD